MSPEQEQEWLMHIAAGTDPLTALAATPTDDEKEKTSPPDRQITSGCSVVVIAVFLLWLFHYL